MKYKLLMVDFDGTLLRSDRTVSPDTINAIKRFKDCGGKVVLCTGRIFNSIKPEAEKLGLSGEIYCYQGGALYDIESGARRAHVPIPNKHLINICKYFEDKDIYFQTYIDDVIFCQKFTEEGNYYYENFSRGARFATNVPLSTYFEKHTDARPTKILAIMDDEKIDGHVEAVLDQFAGALSAFRSEKRFFEVISARSGKGNALLNYCKQCGITPDEAVAIGDSMNDIPMIKNAGLGIAMGNAKEEIKAIADYVCDTNDNDGVAKVIDMLINGTFEMTM